MNRGSGGKTGVGDIRVAKAGTQAVEPRIRAGKPENLTVERNL